jgi:hypothetical protein
MQHQYQAFTARVSFPNTDDSDTQPEVLHDVKVKTPAGYITVQLMAEAPDTAIDMVNRMSDAAIDRLPRVTP